MAALELRRRPAAQGAEQRVTHPPRSSCAPPCRLCVQAPRGWGAVAAAVGVLVPASSFSADLSVSPGIPKKHKEAQAVSVRGVVLGTACTWDTQLEGAALAPRAGVGLCCEGWLCCPGWQWCGPGLPTDMSKTSVQGSWGSAL